MEYEDYDIDYRRASRASMYIDGPSLASLWKVTALLVFVSLGRCAEKAMQRLLARYKHSATPYQMAKAVISSRLFD